MTEQDKKHPKTTPNDARRELDNFWDVENLLPSRPTRRTQPPPRRTPTAVDIELSPRPPAEDPAHAASEPVSAAPLTLRPTGAEEREVSAGDYSRPMASPRQNHPQHTTTEPAPAAVHYVSPHTAAEERTDAPLLEYQPDGVLLHRVKVYGWQANYHYFDQFTKDAERYAAMEAPREARKETFFSYFPQYIQMSRRATAWYLYWREGVRRGQYMDTDYAYVLLYLFELINLPADEPATARTHRDLMAKVWVAYRRAYPQLDHYMCEWLCDYCLIHRLTAPIDLLAPALDDIITGSRLKEFYLSAAVRLPAEEAADKETALETARATAHILMRHCCQYDYRKSKFAQGEHKALFDQTIPAAVASVLPLLLGSNGHPPAITMLDSTLTRDAYTGALCSYQNKRRIEVSFTSFSRSHELRFLIGDMVKHVENRLRSWLGVRSRLSVMSLPIPLRDALDAYLNPLAPPKSVPVVKKKKQPRPAYESFYDLPSKPVSLTDAAAIEADSWETTKILVEAFEDGETPSVSVAESTLVAESTPLVEPSDEDPVRAALTPYIPFIKSALDQDTAAQRTAAQALRKMPDAIADEVNAITADSDIGDIVLEDNGRGLYTVIEDYRDSLTELLHI